MAERKYACSQTRAPNEIVKFAPHILRKLEWWGFQMVEKVFGYV